MTFCGVRKGRGGVKIGLLKYGEKLTIYIIILVDKHLYRIIYDNCS